MRISRRQGSRVLAVAALVVVGACTTAPSRPRPGPATGALPPFPPHDPAKWVCATSPPPPPPGTIAQWCAAHPNRGKPARLPVAPAEISNLAAKNAYDEALRSFLRARTYRSLGWIADQSWRLTGPYVGPFQDGQSYGVHPAVRVWYSPEVVDWLCDGRPDGGPPDGAMIVKEMRSIDAAALGIDPGAECMVPARPPDQIEPASWTVMVRQASVTRDGWYWANPTDKGDGNPPILTDTAVTYPGFFDLNPDHPERNPRWYPTGDLFEDPAAPGSKLADIVTPYSQFAAYCLNCHGSAEKMSTFASLDNVLTSGILYRHFSPPPARRKAAFDDFAGGEHGEADNDQAERAALAQAQKQAWAFTAPLDQPAPGFVELFGKLGPVRFGDAFAFRLPAETFDRHPSLPAGPGPFLTSDQCIGCHDATVSNDSTPNMLITDPDSGQAVNVSPYGEWRASPMGLAGRDPIFFAQLQSETNALPGHAECIENTCLHCHGVMGQRQLAIDTASPGAPCKTTFAVPPPPQVPFGKPFRLGMVTGHQGDPARYGNLARDGISCTVCHHVAEAALGQEASFTGNWVSGPSTEVYGPFDNVLTKPMEQVLGLTPRKAAQISSSDLCGTCHNILLPVFNNDGTPHPIEAPGGRTVTSTYEQTTHLEWVNSDFARGQTFQSCQDCHMPKSYKSVDLAGTRIANIESDAFAPTTHRLPDSDIRLTPRDPFSRHSLHGINLFLNEMFQQFPLLLGVRQIDYMGATTTQPSLITAAESMARMASQETAAVKLESVSVSTHPDVVEFLAVVQVVNKTGHYLPSGVGFRRMFLELTVTSEQGELLWASGRTNSLGVILDGTTQNPLPTESGVAQTSFQPHYQRISQGSQAQIYQELIKDSAGYLTSSFVRRVQPVKDNRIRPKGFDPKVFLQNPSPFIQILGELDGDEGKDPHYFDPKLTGSDQISYLFKLTRQQALSLGEIRVVLYSQSIPPSYLQQRFHDATVGPAAKDQIQRLYYMTSHLNAGPDTRIAGWKVAVAQDRVAYAAGKRR